MKGTPIADYAWLSKGRKYWMLWAGNPFCIGSFKFLLEKWSEEKITKLAIKEQAKEKKRFVKQFPDVEWDCLLLTPKGK